MIVMPFFFLLFDQWSLLQLLASDEASLIWSAFVCLIGGGHVIE